MSIKGAEKEQTIVDTNLASEEGGMTLDVILTNLYLQGSADAGDALNIYNSLMGATTTKASDWDDPDDPTTEEEYEFVSDLYKTEIGEAQNKKLSTFVNDKYLITSKTKKSAKGKNIIKLVQRGINRLYELNGGDGPLKEDGLIGSRTQKVIGALTTYFSALDYVESLGKATGQSVPAAGLFQEEDEETGIGANLVILLDQLLFIAGQKPVQPKVDSVPIDKSFNRILQRKIGDSPFIRADDHASLAGHNEIIQEFSYSVIDVDFDYESDDVIFFQLQENFRAKAVFVSYNNEKLKAYLEGGYITFDFLEPGEEVLQKKEQAILDRDAAEKELEDAAKNHKEGSEEVKAAGKKLEVLQKELRQARKLAEYKLLAFDNGKQVGQFALPFYRSISDSENTYTSISRMEREVAMDNGHPKSIYRIVGKSTELLPSYDKPSDIVPHPAYTVDFSRNPENPNELLVVEDGSLLNKKREKVLITNLGKTSDVDNTNFIQTMALEEDELRLPEAGKVRHYTQNDDGFYKVLSLSNLITGSLGELTDRWLKIDLENRFGDEVALIRRRGVLYVGLRSSPELPFSIYMLDNRNAERVNKVLDAGPNEVLVTRNHNRLVFHTHKATREVPESAELFQINVLMGGKQAGQRRLSLYLDNISYTWDIIFNTVIKEQPLSKQLENIELLKGSVIDTTLLRLNGTFSGHDGGERRKQEQEIDAFQFMQKHDFPSMGEKLSNAKLSLPEAFRAAGRALEALHIGGVKFQYRELSGNPSHGEELKHYEAELERLTEMDPAKDSMDVFAFREWQRMQGEYLNFLIKQYGSLTQSHDEQASGDQLIPVPAVFYAEEAPYIPIPINIHLIRTNGKYKVVYRNEVEASLNRIYVDGEASPVEALKAAFKRLDEEGTLGKGHLYLQLSNESGYGGMHAFHFTTHWKNANQWMGTIMMVGIGLLAVGAIVATGGLAGPAVVSGLVAAGMATTTVTGIYFAVGAVDRISNVRGRMWSDVMFDWVDILGALGGIASGLGKLAKVAKWIRAGKFGKLLTPTRMSRIEGGSKFIGNAGEGLEAISNILAFSAVGVKMGEGRDFDWLADGLNLLAGGAEVGKWVKKFKTAKPNPNATSPQMWDVDNQVHKQLAEADGKMAEAFKLLTKKEQDAYLEMINGFTQEDKIKFSLLVYAFKGQLDVVVSTVKKVVQKPKKGRSFSDNLDNVITLYTKPYLLSFHKRKKGARLKKDFDQSVENIIQQDQNLRQLEKSQGAKQLELDLKEGEVLVLKDELDLAKKNHQKWKKEYDEKAKQLDRDRKDWAQRQEDVRAKQSQMEADLEKSMDELDQIQNNIDQGYEKMDALNKEKEWLQARVATIDGEISALEKAKRDHQLHVEEEALALFKEKYFKGKHIKGGIREVEKAIGAGKEGAKYRKLRGRLESKRDELLNLKIENAKSEGKRLIQNGDFKARDRKMAALREQISNLEFELTGFKIDKAMKELEKIDGNRLFRDDLRKKKLDYEETSRDVTLNSHQLEAELGSIVQANRQKTTLSQALNEKKVANAIEKDLLLQKNEDFKAKLDKGGSFDARQKDIDQGGKILEASQKNIDRKSGAIDDLQVEVKGLSPTVKGLNADVAKAKSSMDTSIKKAIAQLKKGNITPRQLKGLEDRLQDFNWVEFARTVSLAKDINKSHYVNLWSREVSGDELARTKLQDDLGEALDAVLLAEAKVEAAAGDVKAILNLISWQEIQQVPLLKQLVESFNLSDSSLKAAKIRIVMGMFRLAHPEENGMAGLLAKLDKEQRENPEGFDSWLEDAQRSSSENGRDKKEDNQAVVQLTNRFFGFYTSTIESRRGVRRAKVK